MTGLALLFPGQGTQHAGMLPWLEDEPASEPLLARLQQVLGGDWRNRLADSEWSTENAIAQPLLAGVELAAWACLAGHLPRPAAIAGYSVGELAAFSAAGVFDGATAIELARTRAQAMDRSAQGTDTGLVAVRDVPLATIGSWADRHGIAVAIHLGPDRAIVGGSRVALERASADPEVAGRATRLAVRVASHTRWMTAAAEEFADVIGNVHFRPPHCALICNLTGAITRQPTALAHCLAAQVARPVLWADCLDAVAERGVACVLEVGPGTTLATMWRTRYPSVPARSADEFRSAQGLVRWVNDALAADAA